MWVICIQVVLFSNKKNNIFFQNHSQEDSKGSDAQSSFFTGSWGKKKASAMSKVREEVGRTLGSTRHQSVSDLSASHLQINHEGGFDHQGFFFLVVVVVGHRLMISHLIEVVKPNVLINCLPHWRLRHWLASAQRCWFFALGDSWCYKMSDLYLFLSLLLIKWSALVEVLA